MQASLYADNYQQRARECLTQAGGQCEMCGVRQGTWKLAKRSHEFYIVYLHTAHINHDPHNPHAELRALCPACHMRHDRRSEQARPLPLKPHRQGYTVISVERLITQARGAGLTITPQEEGYVWEAGPFSGVAPDVLEALASAFHTLLMEHL